MIEIHPLRDPGKLSKLYKNSGVEMGADSIAVVAADGDEILGFCLFDIAKNSMTVTYLEPCDDVFLADGILRSALHVGVENGVNEAFYSDSAPIKLFERLKFIKNVEKRELNIEKLFASCKNCENS